MKTETNAEFLERIEREGNTAAVHDMCDDLVRGGQTQPHAWMDTRSSWTPENVQIVWKNELTAVERAGREKRESNRVAIKAASKGSCSNSEAIQWVAENLEVEGAEKNAIGPIALSLLKWAKESPSSRSEFFKNLWPKLLPSQKEIDNQARYSDDGSTIIELAERILEGIEDDESK